MDRQKTRRQRSGPKRKNGRTNSLALMEKVMSKKTVYAIVAVIVVLLIAKSMLFTVDETELALVTQFGSPVQSIADAGLYFKLPWPVQSVMRFDKRLLIHDPKPSEYLTSDKKNIVVNSYICYRISDPKRFLETVGDNEGARLRIADVVSSNLGAALARHQLSDLLSTEPGKVKIPTILQNVTSACATVAADQYGITIVDIKLKRLNFPDENKPSVFRRMRTERQKMANKYRAEGEEEALKIRANTNRQKEQILSVARAESQKIMGEGDAEAMATYAAAYGKDPDFYKLTRTLQAYEKFLNEKTLLVLSADSELLQLLSKGPGGKEGTSGDSK